MNKEKEIMDLKLYISRLQGMLFTAETTIKTLNDYIRTIDKKYSHPSPKADYDADAMTNDY